MATQMRDSDILERRLGQLGATTERQGSEIRKLKAQQRSNDTFTVGLLIIFFILLIGQAVLGEGWGCW